MIFFMAPVLGEMFFGFAGAVGVFNVWSKSGRMSVLISLSDALCGLGVTVACLSSVSVTECAVSLSESLSANFSLLVVSFVL